MMLVKFTRAETTVLTKNFQYKTIGVKRVKGKHLWGSYTQRTRPAQFALKCIIRASRSVQPGEEILLISPLQMKSSTHQTELTTFNWLKSGPCVFITDVTKDEPSRVTYSPHRFSGLRKRSGPDGHVFPVLNTRSPQSKHVSPIRRFLFLVLQFKTPSSVFINKSKRRIRIFT